MWIGSDVLSIFEESKKEKHHMNWDQVEGKWKQVKGGVKERWGKLTDDDLDTIAGRRDQLVGKLQERYGITREQAEREIETWRGPGIAEADDKRRIAS
jgi:uncharacterized protein YjbJ (UPF0337 family)